MGTVLAPGSLIGSCRAKAVRDVLRRYGESFGMEHEPLTRSWLELHVEETELGNEFMGFGSWLTMLEELGYLVRLMPDIQAWCLTDSGWSLANAKFGKRHPRALGEAALQRVLDRAHKINADPTFAYRVARITLYGSLVGDAETIGDVDLGVALTPRHADQAAQDALEKTVCRDAPASFTKSYVHLLFWPSQHVYRALRSTDRIVSLTEEKEMLELPQLGMTRLVFEDTVP